MVSVIEEDFASLAFKGLPESKIIVLQIVDLSSGSTQDTRQVNLWIEDAK
jgi:hypothetical protein